MTQRQALKYLGAYIWKRERLGIFFTFLFAVYIGGTLSTSIDRLLGEADSPQALNGLVDWICLTMFPVFGMAMNKSVLAMWRDDYYSKRLAHWRTMPIPIASIVQARLLQSAITMPLISAGYLSLQYGISPNLRSEVTPLQWLMIGAIWACYSLIINVVFIWSELGFNGKRYVQVYLGYMMLTAILSALFCWQGIYLFQCVLEIVNAGDGIALLIGLVIVAVGTTWIFYRATINRIRRRSITF